MADESGATPTGTNKDPNGQAAPQAGKETNQEKPLTQADISRAVNEALKKEREKTAELLADKTKDSESKLTELSAKAAEAERYAGFVDAAITAGIKDLKAAYVVAKELGYLKDGGQFNEKEFKKNHPQFYAPAPNANAGNGAGGSTGKLDMNAYIRAAAGL